VIEDRNELDVAALGIELTSSLHRLYGNEFQLDRTRGMIGARWVFEAIKDSIDARTIAQLWQASLEEFRRARAAYLLYPN
jgi:uncharacterized protein YbbC (DUF1343 family)